LDILEFPGSQFLTGHVMAMFVDGESRIDVETTNAEGFDIRRKITEGGGYSLSIKNINDAWKIDDRGLLRAVYCNRLVGSDEAGRWYDSLKLRTIMLALTPDSKTCQESFLRGFTNWTVSLNDSMRMPDSIAVLKIGLEIASDDYGFTTDLEYAHAKLAATLIANQQDDKVTMLFRQAQSIWPKVDFQRKQVEAYILVVQDKIKSADYSESIDILGRGIEAADGDAKDGLKRVRAEYYCDWSNELVKNKKHEAAAATLITALKHDPDDFIVLGGIAYMTQETLEMIDATNGPASASRWMETLHKKFPDLRQIVEPAKTHVYLLVDKQLKLKDYTKARQTMNERNRLLTKESTAELACRIVDWEAKDLMEQKKWSEAIQVYQLGLKSYPDSHHLKNNLAYAEQSAKSQ
jgi:tetratricopeptide (TPR) repeat protein